MGFLHDREQVLEDGSEPSKGGGANPSKGTGNGGSGGSSGTPLKPAKGTGHGGDADTPPLYMVDPAILETSGLIEDLPWPTMFDDFTPAGHQFILGYD